MDIVELYITRLAEIAAQAPDKRVGSNIQFNMSDFVMSAFSIFFMQSESWLSHQHRLENLFGKSNCQTFFNINKIPTDNHIRHMLDGIEPDYFSLFFDYVLDDMADKKLLDKFTVLGNRKLISIDGTDFFNSQNVHCKNCNHKYHKKNDYFEFFHT